VPAFQLRLKDSNVSGNEDGNVSGSGFSYEDEGVSIISGTGAAICTAVAVARSNSKVKPSP
jgi:hypothetical protein